MDQESIVYGCIRDIPGGDARSRALRLRHNRSVIAALPSADGWPFLSRDMFGVSGFDEMTGTYHTQVVHFGASYRAVEYEWQEWLQKFEQLLSRMYWVSAKVHLETELAGVHTFFWEAEGGQHLPDQGGMRVRCEWEREGLVRMEG